jgi:hypothetical protein
MILYPNDFGCVPDGRFLERASIAAGSAVLADPDRVLRPATTSKNTVIRSTKAIYAISRTKE